MKTRLTIVSMNKKTGPIPVSISSPKTCPASCPFKKKGCYAKGGNTRLHWTKINEYGLEWNEFRSKISKLPKNQLWRHNEAGDLYGCGSIIDSKKLIELVLANKNKRGYTYTHKPVLENNNTCKSNQELIKHANKNGFTINLSANDLKHADRLYDLGIGPVVTTCPENSPKVFYTPQNRKVNLCPATYNENITCSNCGLCANPERKNIIGFPAHGSSKKTVEKIFQGAR